MTRLSPARCDVSHVSHLPDWPALLAQAADIVNSYDTLVTLRQLFYRLVAASVLPNTTNAQVCAEEEQERRALLKTGRQKKGR